MVPRHNNTLDEAPAVDAEPLLLLPRDTTQQFSTHEPQVAPQTCLQVEGTVLNQTHVCPTILENSALTFWEVYMGVEVDSSLDLHLSWRGNYLAHGVLPWVIYWQEKQGLGVTYMCRIKCVGNGITMKMPSTQLY